MTGAAITTTEDGTLLENGTGEFIRVQVVDGTGADMFSAEAECTCPPRVGPTCYLLARWLLRVHDTDTERVVRIEAAAAALGVQPTKIRQAIKRGQRYGLWSHAPMQGLVTVHRRWQPRRQP